MDERAAEPGHAGSVDQLRVAEQLYAERRFADSVQACDALLAFEPANVDAMFLKARATAKQGRVEDALPLVESVLARNPGFVDALRWQGAMLRELYRFREAVPVYRALLQQAPNDLTGLRSLGFCLLQERDWEGAQAAFRQELALEPQSPGAHHNLGFALMQQGAYEQAILQFRNALRLQPSAPRSLLCLGQALTRSGRLPEAWEVFAQAALADPANDEVEVAWAESLAAPEQAREAESHLRKAVKLNPVSSPAFARLGLKLKDLGQFEESAKCFERSLELEPNQGAAYQGLTHGKKLSAEDRPFLERMEGVAAAQSLDFEEEQYLRYALGKAYGDFGNYRESLAEYDLANELAGRLYSGRSIQSIEQTRARTNALIANFTPEFFASAKHLGSRSEMPILIVGMMRSGTTLLEQIVSSHPEVGAGEELTYWDEGWPGGLIDKGMLPDAGQIAELGEGYLNLLGRLAPGKRRVTDKNPFNYWRLGTIHACFPEARILHNRRLPIDNCLSIYVTPYGVSRYFEHSRESIVAFYKEYMRLMDHWRAVLPSDRFMEVDYEQIVADREPVIRKIVEFCGLEWSDACLHHDQNPRSVTTPSNWQVRQPIYKSSTELWRKYEPWLGAFRELVGVRHPHAWRPDL